MTWIRYETGEPPAPALRLSDARGNLFDSSTLYGHANQVIFFAHAASCSACWQTIQRFSKLAERFQALECELIAVLPQEELRSADAALNIRLLYDADGGARQKYNQLVEFDIHDKLLLCILDRYGAPSAAWIGDEADEPDLHERALQRLEYISIQCPE
jgi:peroxiredoxin